MEGVILCKSRDNVNIIAMGNYEVLQGRLEHYCKIAGSNDIKIVNITGFNIHSIIQDQTQINKTFENEFSNV